MPGSLRPRPHGLAGHQVRLVRLSPGGGLRQDPPVRPGPGGEGVRVCGDLLGRIPGGQALQLLRLQGRGQLPPSHHLHRREGQQRETLRGETNNVLGPSLSLTPGPGRGPVSSNDPHRWQRPPQREARRPGQQDLGVRQSRLT